MRTIHKYVLLATDMQEVSMPSGASILHVGVQRSEICLWALVEDGNARNALLRVYVRGTGHDCTGMLAATHLGSVLMDIGGGLVFHVFGAWVRQ